MVSVVIKIHGLYKLNWKLRTWVLEFHCVPDLMLLVSNLTCDYDIVLTRWYAVQILRRQGISSC
jgi:hypothetical protein